MAAFVAQFQFVILCIFSGLLGLTILAAFVLALRRSGVWVRLRNVCADRTECGPYQKRISSLLVWLCVVPLVCVLVVRGSTKNGGTNDPPQTASLPPGVGVFSLEPATTTTLTADDFGRGFVLTGIGTGEVFDFSPPSNAVVCADWRAFGAARDWTYLRFDDWAFALGTNEVDCLRVLSHGEVEPLPSSPARRFAPFRASLGVVPEANWPLLPAPNAPSQFWHWVTPRNSLLLTWRNVLLNRLPETPVSFQMEIWDDGRFAYRYDLSRLGAASASNFLAGVSLGESAVWTTNTLPTNVTSLAFHALVEADAVDLDRDGDGLSASDEVFVHGTDPGSADTDEDGLSDPDEIAAGTDPRNPDTDGDGLLDGEEVQLGSNPFSGDGDADGVGDWEEIQRYGTNPLLADSDGDGLSDAAEIAGTTDPTMPDTDGDGLSDAAEIQHGTNPNNPDTDGDGALDGWEIEQGSNPFVTDTDGDGLADGIEARLGSSPLLIDTDGDGFGDFDEYTALGTSPARADTDGDGLDDDEEFELGTNSVRADTDGDGLSDGEELELETDPFDPDMDNDGLEDGAEVVAGTSPFVSDTDGDGMPDAWEVRHGLNPRSGSDATWDEDRDGLRNIQEFQHGTSPVNADTDGDGRGDGDEVDYGTSPVLADTDGDGLDDGDEFERDTNGANPDSDFDGLPDGWEVAHNLDPRNAGGSYGASDDPDGDGLTNAEEYALGTHPRMTDTDGDGLDDGEEVGCSRIRYAEDNEWASTTNGWTAVTVERDEGTDDKWSWFILDESLKVGDEWVYDVVCQWNGLVIVSSDNHYLHDVVTSGPVDLSGTYVSDAALMIAPYWTESVTDSVEPEIDVFRRVAGTDVLYAVQYTELAAGGMNTVTFQATLVFTNGVYRMTEIVYREDLLVDLGGLDASIGVQDAVGDVRLSFGYREVVSVMPFQKLQLISGTGTDPLAGGGGTDVDGDGLSDALEREIGTDPEQPDSDGDGMHDGWERQYGFNPRVDNDDAEVDADPANDFGADPDNDGLANGAEADWGTDPHNDDTDGDGVTDGEEVENCSAPADATDGGRPGSRVPVNFYFGDPSGSHSEKYRLVVTPKRDPNGQMPSSGGEPKSFEWVNAQYGECETKTAMLLRGWIYEVRMFHAGTNIEDGSPDYDYSLVCSPPSCVGVVTNDPQRLFGVNGNGGESFEADGKAATVLVLDGCLVGDYDHDGAFTDHDLSRVYRNRPLRHWINDDDDEGDVNEGSEDIPGLRDPSWMVEMLSVGMGRSPDFCNDHVDGRSDILDFTPVWMDMGFALRQIADMFGGEAEDFALTLSQPEGTVNVVWTSLATNNVGDFLTTDLEECGADLSEALREAKTVHLTEEETRVPDALVSAMLQDRSKGVFLFEGRGRRDGHYYSRKQIVLRCHRKPYRPSEDTPLLELKLPISISPVADMFRWIDYRHLFGVTNHIPTNPWIPWNNPDDECNCRHYVFVHGYNVSTNEALGWASEMFKRLRQSGSRAMFTAVDWYGDDSQIKWNIPRIGGESPNYYVNVEHAFATAEHFARDWPNNPALPGEKILLAHSLGNVLVSSAIKDHGLSGYLKYYMLNAAVPIEAYDGAAFAPGMVEPDWRDLTDRVYAANWWRLFSPGDARRALRWNGRFAGIPNAVNCYSPSEDTLGNIANGQGMVASLWRKNFWAAQELNKGTLKQWTLSSALGRNEGGWGFNPEWGRLASLFGVAGRRARNKAQSESNANLIRSPVFTPFDEDWLHSTNAVTNLTASIRNRILADGIPATSFAAGANAIREGIVDDNIDYTSLNNGFPEGYRRWRHSDLKQFAFFFVHKFFRKIDKESEENKQ